MPPLISVIIPALHRPDLTAQCLASVLPQLPPAELQIIVVEDDAPHGPVYEGALPQGSERVLLEGNVGFAAAVNRGLARARGEFALLLNNDCELRPECIAALRQALLAEPQAAFACGKLLQQHDPAKIDGAWDAFLAGGAAYRIGHESIDGGQYESPRKVLAGCGALLLLRRELALALGGFDESFFAYLEDVDFCLRAHWAGYCGLYVPAAVGLHRGSATLGAALHPKVVEWITRNQLLVVAKNYSVALALRTLPRRLLYQLLWLFRTIAERRFLAHTRGSFGVLPRLPAALRAHRRIARSRRISSAQFLDLLRDCEREVAEWQRDLPPELRSRLLKIYFSIFHG